MSSHSPRPVATRAADLVGDVTVTPIRYRGGHLSLWIGRDANGGLVLSGGALNGGSRTREFTVEAPINSQPYSPFQCSARDPLAAGFYCGSDVGELGADHHSWLIVGYVVGDVSTVSLTIDGHVHTAAAEAWSENPRVHIYWSVGPVLQHYRSKAQGSAMVTEMIARDAVGRIVARNNGAIEHG
jgi:ribosomal protein S18 acetylase RimI-like enzyme